MQRVTSQTRAVFFQVQLFAPRFSPQAVIVITRFLANQKHRFRLFLASSAFCHNSLLFSEFIYSLIAVKLPFDARADRQRTYGCGSEWNDKHHRLLLELTLILGFDSPVPGIFRVSTGHHFMRFSKIF